MNLSLPFDPNIRYAITQTYQQHVDYRIAHKLTNYNGGIDYYFYDQPEGTFVKPAGPGIVTFAGWDTATKDDGTPGGYGLHVRIRHSDGTVTIYAHLSKIFVATGAKIFSSGFTIGASGNTGNSTGPHLHFEVRTPANVAVDPQGYFDAAVPVAAVAIKKGDRVRVDAAKVNLRLKPDKYSLDMGDALSEEEFTVAGDEVKGNGNIRFVPVEVTAILYLAVEEAGKAYAHKI